MSLPEERASDGAADEPGPEPHVRQRIGAYAICVRNGQILLSQLSERTGWPGTWTLPGGGIDHGEHPRDAVVRECWEETGLEVQVGPLLDVDSRHAVGQGLRGRLEDYHAVRLVFVGAVASDREPAVQEVDGSTAAAAWIDLARVDGDVPVTALVRFAIDLLAARQS